MAPTTMTSQKLLAFGIVLCAAVAGAKSAQTVGYKYVGGSGNGGNGQSSFKINWNGNSSYENKSKNGAYFYQQYDCHAYNHNDHGRVACVVIAYAAPSTPRLGFRRSTL